MDENMKARSPDEFQQQLPQSNTPRQSSSKPASGKTKPRRSDVKSRGAAFPWHKWAIFTGLAVALVVALGLLIRGELALIQRAGVALILALFSAVVIHMLVTNRTRSSTDIKVNLGLVTLHSHILGPGATAVTVFVVFMALTKTSYQTIDLMLRNPDRTLLQRDFTYTYHHPDIGPQQDRDGNNGFASIRALPVRLLELDVSVKCPGFTMRDVPPLEIIGRTIQIVMIPEERPPAPPENYPFIDENMLPNKGIVLQKPKVSGKEVCFHYHNQTTDELELFLYDCYGHFKSPVNPEGLEPATKWIRMPFKPGPVAVHEDFGGGSGWYAFFVRDAKRNDFHLGNHAIFQSRNPWLIVTKKDGMYIPQFRFDP